MVYIQVQNYQFFFLGLKTATSICTYLTLHQAAKIKSLKNTQILREVLHYTIQRGWLKTTKTFWDFSHKTQIHTSQFLSNKDQPNWLSLSLIILVNILMYIQRPTLHLQRTPLKHIYTKTKGIPLSLKLRISKFLMPAYQDCCCDCFFFSLIFFFFSSLCTFLFFDLVVGGSMPGQGCCNFAYYPYQGNRTPRSSLPACSQNWPEHSLLSLPTTMEMPQKNRLGEELARAGWSSHPQIEHPESMG